MKTEITSPHIYQTVAKMSGKELLDELVTPRKRGVATVVLAEIEMRLTIDTRKIK